MDITLDIKKSLEENAATYYEKAKKAKAKMPGIKKVINETENKRHKIEKDREKHLKVYEAEEQELQEQKAVKKQWYEKFRWFFSSGGFLAIGGRDATSNDILIKKHVDKGDLIFHTDMAGSPFFIIKAEGREIDEQTKQEVAQATASYSRGWQKGLAVMEVFSCSPSAIGRQVAKGAFVIEGKVTYYNPELMLAAGIKDNKVMIGPVAAVKAHRDEVLIIVQGNNKKSDIAKQIKKKLGGDLDTIMQGLPTGDSKIIA